MSCILSWILIFSLTLWSIDGRALTTLTNPSQPLVDVDLASNDSLATNSTGTPRGGTEFHFVSDGYEFEGNYFLKERFRDWNSVNLFILQNDQTWLRPYAASDQVFAHTILETFQDEAKISISVPKGKQGLPIKWSQVKGAFVAYAKYVYGQETDHCPFASVVSIGGISFRIAMTKVTQSDLHLRDGSTPQVFGSLYPVNGRLVDVNDAIGLIVAAGSWYRQTYRTDAYLPQRQFLLMADTGNEHTLLQINTGLPDFSHTATCQEVLNTLFTMNNYLQGRSRIAQNLSPLNAVVYKSNGLAYGSIMISYQSKIHTRTGPPTRIGGNITESLSSNLTASSVFNTTDSLPLDSQAPSALPETS